MYCVMTASLLIFLLGFSFHVVDAATAIMTPLLVPGHDAATGTSVSADTSSDGSATDVFGPMDSAEMIYSFKVDYDTIANVIYPVSFTQRLIFSTCHASTDYDTHLTILDSQSGDTPTSVDLASPSVVGSSSVDYNCALAEPQKSYASAAIYDKVISDVYNDVLLLYVVVEGYDIAEGTFSMSIEDCGSACLTFDSTSSCSCAICAQGFSLDDNGNCVLEDCVTNSEGTPRCECASNFNGDPLWNTTGSRWEIGTCAAECGSAPDCEALNREECSAVPNTCGPCLSKYGGDDYDTDANTVCDACFDTTCLSCTDDSRGSCLECEYAAAGGECFEPCPLEALTAVETSFSVYGEISGDEAFESISVQGSWAAVGYRRNDGSIGAVRLYKETAPNSWTLEQEWESEGYGGWVRSAIIDSGRLVIIDFDGYHVLEETDGIWTDVNTWPLTRSDGVSVYSSMAFWASLAVHDGLIISGAPRDNGVSPPSGVTEMGAVLVYDETSPGVWTLEDVLDNPSAGQSNRFGNAVAVLDRAIVVGCEKCAATDDTSEAGATWVFEEVTPGEWEEAQRLPIASPAAGRKYGYSVSMTLVEGKYYIASGSGSYGQVYATVYSGTTFSTFTEDQEIYELSAAKYGAVALSGATMVLQDDIYTLDTDTNTWSIVVDDYFNAGHYDLVAISASTIIVVDRSNSDYIAYGGAAFFLQADCIPPTFDNCPAETWVVEAASATTLGLTLTLTDSLDASPTLSCTPAIDSVFPFNVPTDVSCTGSDSVANLATCNFTAHVFSSAGELVFCPSNVIEFDTRQVTLADDTIPGLTFDEAYVSGSATYAVTENVTGTWDLVTVTASADTCTFYVQSNGCQWTDYTMSCIPVLESATIHIAGSSPDGSTARFASTSQLQIAIKGSFLDLYTNEETYALYYESADGLNAYACLTGSYVDAEDFVCVMPGIGSLGAMSSPQHITFKLAVTMTEPSVVLTSESSTDVLNYAEKPIVNSISGCEFETTLIVTSCGTRGNEIIQIYGNKLELAGYVEIGGVPAKIVPGSRTEVYMEVYTPQRVGSDLLLQVFQVDEGSVAEAYVTYSAPVITSITGCVSGDNENSTYSCPTDGLDDSESPITVTLSGKNFGESGAEVYIGKALANNIQHVFGEDHETLTFDLPEGGGEENAILALQLNGRLAAAPTAFVSYAECKDGFYLDSEKVCQRCSKGKYTNSGTVKSYCSLCDPGTFAPELNSTDCITCDDGSSQENSGAANCTRCDAGKFSNADTPKSSCTDCGLGKYQSEENMDTCVECPDGMFANETGMTECLSCPKGSYTNENTVKYQCTPCSLGEYQPERNQTACEVCPNGRFAGVEGTTDTCKGCPKGSYTNDDTVKYQCTMCPPGEYQPQRNQTSCEVCPNGRFTGAVGTTNECEVCSSGKYTSDDTLKGSCTECGLGTFQPDSNQDTCLQCPSGTFANETGMSACLPCPKGSYTNEDTVKYQCTPCSLGEYQPERNQTACEVCPNGRFAGVEGTTNECEVCSSGKYTSDDTLKGSCTECGLGTFQPDSNQDTCLQCPSGTFANETGMSACLPCPKGSYTNEDTVKYQCTPCSLGEYQPERNQTSCIACPSGRYADVEGTTDECKQCAGGSFTNDDTVKYVCSLCEPGTVQDLEGQSKCNDCLPGTFADANGATNCSICDAGSFSTERASECKACLSSKQFAPTRGLGECLDCPTGSRRYDYDYCECDAGMYRVDLVDQVDEFECVECESPFICEEHGYDATNLILPEGYWRESAEAVVAFPCIVPENCPGGAFIVSNDTNSTIASALTCNFPSTGAGCVLCEPGYTSAAVGEPCAECLPVAELVLLTVSSIIAATIGMGLYIRHILLGKKKKKTETGVLFKILFSSLQLNAIALSFSFDWNGFMQGLLKIQQSASSAGSGVVDIACFGDSAKWADQVNGTPPFFIECLIFLLAPVMVILFISMIMTPYYAFQICRKKSSFQNARRSWEEVVEASMLIILFLLHPTLSNKSMEIFTCTTVGDNDFVSSQMDVECFGSTHLRWALFVGIPMVFLYAIGIPLGGMWYLQKHLAMLKENPTDEKVKFWQAKYGFLFEGYQLPKNEQDKSKFFLWEAVVSARKLGLMFVATVFLFNEPVQVLMGMFVVTVAMCAHFYAYPFVNATLNFAEGLSLISSFMTFFLGSLTFVDRDYVSQSASNVCSILAVLINVSYIIFMCVLLVRSLKRSKKDDNNKEDVKELEDDHTVPPVGKEKTPPEIGVELIRPEAFALVPNGTTDTSPIAWDVAGAKTAQAPTPIVENETKSALPGLNRQQSNIVMLHDDSSSSDDDEI